MSLLSMYIRYNFGKGDRKRDAGLSTPEEIRRFDDLQYGEDRKWNVLDVYRPKDKEGKLPVIVSFHGGGWVYGDKNTYQYYCMSLAQRGFAVVNFSYRLAPEHKYPSQLVDCNKAIKWVADHEEEYGFDLDNVFAVGDSAGAHLLSAYCAMLSDADYAKYYDIDVPEGFIFKAIALNCGIYKQEVGEKRDMNSSLMRDVLPKGYNKKDLAMFSTYDKINEHFPRVFLMSANGDFLANQVDILLPELERNKVEHVVKIYGKDDRILGHVFHVNIRLEDAKLCNDEECAFFMSHLRKKNDL